MEKAEGDRLTWTIYDEVSDLCRHESLSQAFHQIWPILEDVYLDLSARAAPVPSPAFGEVKGQVLQHTELPIRADVGSRIGTQTKVGLEAQNRLFGAYALGVHWSRKWQVKSSPPQLLHAGCQETEEQPWPMWQVLQVSPPRPCLAY